MAAALARYTTRFVPTLKARCNRARVIPSISERTFKTRSQKGLYGPKPLPASANQHTSERHYATEASSFNRQLDAGNENVTIRSLISDGLMPDDALKKGQLHDPSRQVFNHPAASIILRDSCKCAKCKDPDTSQRNFNLAQIPVDIKPYSVRQDSQNNWIVRWQNDIPGWEDHESIFTPQHVTRLCRNMEEEHITTTQLWDKESFAKDRFTVTYEDYMSSDAALAKALYYFGRHGLVFIKNVPEDELSVIRLAQRISSMKNTFYGATWDLRSMPNAKNVAFTNKYLGFHGDMVYLKEPPTGQFLHCLHNSAKGGENRFVDQFKAFDTILHEDRDLATALTRTKLRYEYDNDGFYYTDIKPIVQFRTASHQFPKRAIEGPCHEMLHQVYRMFWAPQFLGSIMPHLGLLQDDFEKYLSAMKKYTEILERNELVFEEKMDPGTAIFFDNLRILHARNEFDPNTGKRWLRGTYLDAQDVWSHELKLRDHMLLLEAEKGAEVAVNPV